MSLDKMHQSPNHPALSVSRPTLSAQRARLVPAEQYAVEKAAAWRCFGELLRAERLVRGISRQRVLEALEMHPLHDDYVLTLIEDGLQELSVDQARQLQDELGVPAVHLMAQAGVATLEQLAATGDDMPLAGRQVTPPTVARRRFVDVRAEALGVLGFIGGAVLIVVAFVVSLSSGHWLALVWSLLMILGAVACLSVPCALLVGRVFALPRDRS